MQKSTGTKIAGTVTTTGERARAIVAALAAVIATGAFAQGFQAPDIEVDEGSDAVFTVTLPHAMAVAVRWQYETEDGTATSGSDYQSSTGHLVVAAGDTTEAVDVRTLTDSVADGGETFKLKLFNFQMQRSDGSWATDAVYGIPSGKTMTATIQEGT